MTLNLYGQTVHLLLRQPGMVNGRRPRSDQIALKVDGVAVMSLREAALDAVKRMPRVLTRKEAGSALSSTCSTLQLRCMLAARRQAYTDSS